MLECVISHWCFVPVEKRFVKMSKTQPIRRLLLAAYCGTACAALCAVLALSLASIAILKNSVLTESEIALSNQIYANSGHLLTESGEVLSAKFTTGFQTLGLPVAYAVADVHQRGTSYSTRPGRSYADTSKNHLRQDVLTTARELFSCKSTDSYADRQRRGCVGDLRSYSDGTSACYLANVLPYDDSWDTYSYPGPSDDLLRTYIADPFDRDGVRATAVIDDFVRAAFDSMTGWNGAFVALEYSNSWDVSSTSLYRQFPGFVMDLTEKNGVRTYDPKDRDWFSSWKDRTPYQMSTSDVGRYVTEVTAPYLDRFGNGYLISLTASVPTDSGFTGVAGTDILVAPLADLVSDLKLRQTGVVHLYHVGTGIVASSPQWSADPEEDTMLITDILLDAAGNGAKIPSSSSCSGHEEVDGHLVIRREADNYCVVAVVKIAEVVAPIEDQKDGIESTASSLMLTVVAIISGCFFLLVMPCTVLLSLQLSRPLVTTSKQSRVIARNIGGDLLQDVWIDAGGGARRTESAGGLVRAGEAERRRCLDGGIGEVTELRAGFINLLAQLQRKRETPPTPALNPLYTKVLLDEAGDDADPNAPSGAVSSLVEDKIGRVTVKYCDPTLQPKAALMDIPDTPWYNRVSLRLVLQLVCPLAGALLAIVVITTTLMLSKTTEWIEPITSTMVQEELTSLELRCQQRGELVMEMVGSSLKTLVMIQAYATSLYSNSTAMSLDSGYRTAFAGVTCPNGGSACHFEGFDLYPDEQRLITSPPREVNVGHSAWYAPRYSAAPAYRRQAASLVADVGEAYLDQQHADEAPYDARSSRASHLDNACRVGYFASDVTDVYFGWEHNEAYRIYPYRELSDWYWTPRDFPEWCGSVSQGYTPLCRSWYQDAVAAQGSAAYGEVAWDPDNGQTFVSISAAFYDNEAGEALPGKLVGVVAVSMSLRKLKETLENTPLYENGYAYIFDVSGNAVIHPDWDLASSPTSVVELAKAGDDEFGRAYQEGIVNAFGQEGTWNGEWYNPDTDEKETWYYAFRPIPDTPYQLVLGVSELEVEKAAVDLEEKLRSLAITQCVVTTIVLVITSMLLVFVSMMFQHSFIHPVKKLKDLVTQAEKEGFKTNVDTTEDVISLELGTLKRNFTKLLTALRFNNPDYHKGDKGLELANLREAEAIVKETGNLRGIGVCKNNLGNLVRGMSAQEKQRLPAEDRDPRRLLEAAVRNAQELVTDPGSHVSEDQVGTRMLGLALARLDHGEERKAVDDLKEALAIHKGSGSWQALARLGFVLASRLEADSAARRRAKQPSDSTANEMTMQLVDKFSEQAVAEAAAMLKALGASTSALPVADATPLAQLCYCLSIFSNDNRYSMWALNSIMNLDVPMVNRLAKQVEEEPILTAEARHIMQNTCLKGASKRKFMCFCIDRTWTPILEVCISSICTIIKEHTNEDDVVCMFGLGTGWLIREQRKGLDGNDLLSRVRAAEEVKGKCHLYRGMLETLGNLAAQPADVNKWLVVLTDLVDLEGSNPKYRYSAVRDAIANMPKDSRLAVIDTSNISGWEPEDRRWPVFRSNMREFSSQAAVAGHGGHLLVADDLQALKAKFAEVGVMMAEADLGEHL